MPRTGRGSRPLPRRLLHDVELPLAIPGEPYSAHGHYINMTNPQYRSLECGFYEADGHVWLVQNYFP